MTLPNLIQKYFSPFECMYHLNSLSKTADACDLEMRNSANSIESGIEYMNKYGASCDSHARLSCMAQNNPEAVRGVLTSCPNFVVNWSLAKYPGMRTPGVLNVLEDSLRSQSNQFDVNRGGIDGNPMTPY